MQRYVVSKEQWRHCSGTKAHAVPAHAAPAHSPDNPGPRHHRHCSSYTTYLCSRRDDSGEFPRHLCAASSCLGITTNIEVLYAAHLEALAHSPSQMPLSCLSLPSCAPISARAAQRQGGGGAGVARRARAAQAPKAKFCATSCGTSSAAPCAASTRARPSCVTKGRRGGRARVRVTARRSMTFFL